MTEEMQARALAKREGWELVPGSLVCWSRDGGATYTTSLPTYTSLDDLHRLEERLTWEQRSDYYQILAWKVCNGPNEAISAKTEHRREALLRALNLWTDTP